MHPTSSLFALPRSLARGVFRTESPHLRPFATTCSRHSGHNRWSKIKHDKAKVDSNRNKIRSYLSREITVASRVGGSDPQTNARLSALLAEAKRAEFPKASVERAIARGQGVSATGAALEAFSIEFMLPPATAGILEVETDSRARTIQDVKAALRDAGGAVTPSAYLFDRRGRVAFDANPAPDQPTDPPAAVVVTEEAVLESAIDAGALDVETDDRDGEIVVWTEPAEMAAVADAVSAAVGVPARSQQLVYVAKEETRTEDSSEALEKLIAKFEDISDIQEIHLNTVQ